tara:strand:+ start:18999 stop:19154 length:156 start_codon:yes stop_codon:yes gene_type:complete
MEYTLTIDELTELVSRAIYNQSQFDVINYPDGSIKSIDEDAITEFIKLDLN